MASKFASTTSLISTSIKIKTSHSSHRNMVITWGRRRHRTHPTRHQHIPVVRIDNRHRELTHHRWSRGWRRGMMPREGQAHGRKWRRPIIVWMRVCVGPRRWVRVELHWRRRGGVNVGGVVGRCWPWRVWVHLGGVWSGTRDRWYREGNPIIRVNYGNSASRSGVWTSVKRRGGGRGGRGGGGGGSGQGGWGRDRGRRGRGTKCGELTTEFSELNNDLRI